MLQCVMYCAGI